MPAAVTNDLRFVTDDLRSKPKADLSRDG